MNTNQWVALLKQDVVPALGCTEPVCVALCAAHTGQLLTGQILSITVQTNAGIYKNGMSAGIPNCPHVGLHWAAAIGSLLKNPQKQLQLLEDLTSRHLSAATELIASNQVTVSVNTDIPELFVRCTLHSDEDTVTATIQSSHTNLVHLEKNGQVLMSTSAHSQTSNNGDIIAALKSMTVAQIRQVVEEIPVSELDFLMDGVQMNEDLAAYSEAAPSGVGIADALRQEIGSSLFANDLLNRILTKVASAAESRLDGCPLPTMSSSGAGTKGLVVILPVSETAKALGCSKELTLRALAFAHLTNRYINAWIGKLSPMCSCVMASSTAASAAITHLLGGNDE